MASMGVYDPGALTADMLRKRVSSTVVRSYAELYEWLRPGELLAEPPSTWLGDWRFASPESFRPTAPR